VNYLDYSLIINSWSLLKLMTETTLSYYNEKNSLDIEFINHEILE